MSVKSDFAEIYSQWEKSHDENSAIAKKVKAEKASEKPANNITVGELKKMKVQDELDLHNVKLDEATMLVNSFLDASYKKHLRKVRLITGKGLHSPNGVSVIRPQVLSLVSHNAHVSSFDANPKAIDGGSGAVIVYLKA